MEKKGLKDMVRGTRGLFAISSWNDIDLPAQSDPVQTITCSETELKGSRESADVWLNPADQSQVSYLLSTQSVDSFTVSNVLLKCAIFSAR